MSGESSMGAGLAIYLFGGFDAKILGAPVQGLHRREGERLLAYLTLRAEETISYGALAKLFWPFEAEQNMGLGNDYLNTRQAVRALRIALGPEATRLQSPGKGSVRFQ